MDQWTEPFIFKDGTAAHTITELLSKLRQLTDKEFDGFVNNTKHDFGNWILFGLKQDRLGNFVMKLRTRASLIAGLEDYIYRSNKQSSTTEPQTVVREYHPEHQPTISQVDQKERLTNPPEQEVEEPERYQPHLQEEALEEHTEPKKDMPTEDKPLEQDPYQPPKQETKIEEPQEEVQPEPTQEHAEVVDQDDDNDTASMENQVVVDKLKEEPMVTDEEVTKIAQQLAAIKHEIAKVFKGQEETIHGGIIALLCEAHVLLEGVPGLAKSVLVETIAKTISGATFRRIQFLPDLLPADVIGGQIYNPKTGEFKTVKGPIFGNFVLADEVNRAPPKTHAALMEAMAERKINIDKEEFILERPFLVMATQNPLENKGTYELPEAVMDRFMFKIDMDYPKRKDELVIITENNTTKAGLRKTVKPVVDKTDILFMQKKIKTVHLSDRIKEYILDIVEATRGLNKNIQGIKFVKYGAGPRASIALGIAAKAEAVMDGRNYVLPKDINAVSKNILRHRVSLNFKGKAYNITSDRIIEEILEKVVAM